MENCLYKLNKNKLKLQWNLDFAVFCWNELGNFKISLVRLNKDTY